MYVRMYVRMYYVCMYTYIYIYIVLQKYSPSLYEVLIRGNTLNTPKLGGRRVGKTK